MYYYILDPHKIPQKDFERQQTELQTLLTEFKIGGETARVTPLRTFQELVDTAAARGATTVVACGTDETFSQMLLALKGREFTLAFVPFRSDTQLGKILGMKDLPTAVKTIASRRIEKIDIAKINDSFFISYLEMGIGIQTNKKLGFFESIKLFRGNTIDLKLRIDDSFDISSRVMGALLVNTRGTEASSDSRIGNPQDGLLDLLMIEKLNRVAAAQYKKEIAGGLYEKVPTASAIKCKKVEFLQPHGLRIHIDGNEVAQIPAIVEVLPSRLKIIVGKTRTF